MTTSKELIAQRMHPRFDPQVSTAEDDAAEAAAMQKLAASVLTYNRILDFFCGLSLSALVVCLGIFAYQAVQLSL